MFTEFQVEVPQDGTLENESPNSEVNYPIGSNVSSLPNTQPLPSEATNITGQVDIDCGTQYAHFPIGVDLFLLVDFLLLSYFILGGLTK